MPPSILTATLDAIESERVDLSFDRSFDLVDRLLVEFGEADLAERLHVAIPIERPWEVVADLFGILTWSTRDNGSALMRATDDWLRAGDDVRKIQIALNMDHYPFFDRSEMETVLATVASRHPEVAAKCGELIESRRKSSE